MTILFFNFCSKRFIQRWTLKTFLVPGYNYELVNIKVDLSCPVPAQRVLFKFLGLILFQFKGTLA
jgi:hypothetical protein